MNVEKEVVLSAHDLTIGYRQGRSAQPVAAGIHVTLRTGELVCLLGPNGAGKTTLMRTIAGMQPPLAGQVRLLDENVFRLPPKELAKRLSLVLTDRLEIGALSVYELVALGRYPHTDWINRLRPRDERVIEWALRAVGAWHLAGRSAQLLSDGERQKVLIARALAQEPAVIILDEPTAFLDLPRRVEIMQLLRDLAQEGRAVLISTHDLDLALRSADQFWLLSDEGEVVVGAPEDLVLSGAFSETFASAGVEFEIATGAFRIRRKGGRRVRVVGRDPWALWTRRALERAGMRVEAEAELTVHVTEGEPRWCIEWSNPAGRPLYEGDYARIYDLLNALKALPQQDEPAQLERETMP